MLTDYHALTSRWLSDKQQSKQGAGGSMLTADTPLTHLRKMFISEQQAKGNTPKTIKYYNGIWDSLYRFISFSVGGDDAAIPFDAVGEVPVQAILFADLQLEYREYMQEVRCAAEQTVLSHLRGIRALMQFIQEASKHTIITADIKVRDIDPPIKEVYSTADIALLSKKPDPQDFINYRAWMIGRVVMATGCRAGSIAGLKVRDVDCIDGFLSLNTVKNREPIILPLVRDATRELGEYVSCYRSTTHGVGEQEPLFTNRYGQALTANAVGRLFQRYCANKGLPPNKQSIHLLRHTFAKNYIMSGGDVLSLKAMLGHKSLKMVNHYVRLYGDQMRSAVEKHSLISATKQTSGRKVIRMAHPADL